MLANDIDGNTRLEVAKAIVKHMVQGLKNDRLGLVVFAGETMVQSPISYDKNAFLTFLDRINPNLLAKKSTNLAKRALINPYIPAHRQGYLPNPYSERGLNPYDHNGHRILSPVCLPIPPLRLVYYFSSSSIYLGSTFASVFMGMSRFMNGCTPT